MSRHFVTIGALRDDDLREIYAEARRPARSDELSGQRVGLLFEHPSLRTRASSVAAVQSLGAHVATFTGDEIGLDTRESAPDVARTLQATCDILALRVRSHGVFARMIDATQGQLGLINLLSDFEHPTQAVADVLTLADHFAHGDPAKLRGLTVAYVGDANNVARSLAGALLRLGVHVRIGSPAGYQFSVADGDELNRGVRDGATLTLTDSATDAVANADALYTDVWVSMGQESQREQRRVDLAAFQLNQSLLAAAAPHAVVLHCLPAHRGEEIAEEVLESPASLVWQQVRHRTSSMVGVLRWIEEKEA